MGGPLVRKRRLSEDVAEHLERMIQDGTFAETDRLPSERELMRHFGVGRPSVREALLHLRKMGLVEIGSGERARVTRPTPQFVIDALAGPPLHARRARRRPELPERAHLLRDRARPPCRRSRDRRGPRRLRGRARGEPPVDRRSRAVRADRRRLPLRAGADPAQPDLHRDPRRARRVAARAAPDHAGAGRGCQAYDAHRAIFEAVAARDPDRAERAMRDHLEYVARRYTEVVGAAG